MPKVSVIAVAKTKKELKALELVLKNQTFADFEFVGEAGGTISQALNRAVKKAKGELIVITETDAYPLNNRWLEELIASVKSKKELVKGVEIRPIGFNFSNLIGHRSIFEKFAFDQSFTPAEDTEFFERIRQAGIKLKQVKTAPMIHFGGADKRKMLSRAFSYGFQRVLIDKTYDKKYRLIDYLILYLSEVALNLLYLAGTVWGYLVSFFKKRKQKE